MLDLARLDLVKFIQPLGSVVSPLERGVVVPALPTFRADSLAIEGNV